MKMFIVNSRVHGYSTFHYFETLEEAKVFADKAQKKRKKSISVYKIHEVKDCGLHKWMICSEEYNTKGEYLGYNADGTPIKKANIRICDERTEEGEA